MLCAYQSLSGSRSIISILLAIHLSNEGQFKVGALMPRTAVPPEVAAIRAHLRRFLNSPDAQGGKVGDAKYGVYAFYDYDGEPIYVGQTKESLRSRIGRHLTNQRTDAVAMNVLDPFEVAEIQVWPIPEERYSETELRQLLNQVEYAVFQKVLRESKLRAVLNEKDIPP